jgi:hypothetical protein
MLSVPGFGRRVYLDDVDVAMRPRARPFSPAFFAFAMPDFGDFAGLAVEIGFERVARRELGKDLPVHDVAAHHGAVMRVDQIHRRLEPALLEQFDDA